MKVFEVKINFECISKRKFIVEGAINGKEYLDTRVLEKVYFVLAEDDISSRVVAIDLLKKKYKTELESPNNAGFNILYCEINKACEISE